HSHRIRMAETVPVFATENTSMRLRQVVAPRCTYSRHGNSSMCPPGQATINGAGSVVALCFPRPLQPGALQTTSCHFESYSTRPSPIEESVRHTGHTWYRGK